MSSSTSSSCQRPAVRIVKNIRNTFNNMAHNYPKMPDFPLAEENLPFQIGKNILVKEYNTFLDNNEKTGYKFRWENKNVFIVDMANPVREGVINMLQDYFKVPNGGVFINPPIDVLGQPFHYDPSDNTHTLKRAADVTISPSDTHITNPITMRHPGPPPCDITLNPHGRIFCEIAYSADLAYLETTCETWMIEPCVRYVLGIKIYEKRKRSNDRTMTAKLYSRVAAPSIGPPAVPVATRPGVFVQEVRLIRYYYFGCIAKGNPAYLITIPVSEVFWDPPIGVPGGYISTVPATVAVTTPNFVIDLFNIQQEILKKSP